MGFVENILGMRAGLPYYELDDGKVWLIEWFVSSTVGTAL